MTVMTNGEHMPCINMSMNVALQTFAVIVSLQPSMQRKTESLHFEHPLFDTLLSQKIPSLKLPS